MKKLAILSMTLLLALSLGQLQAQVKEREAIKETKKVIKTEKKELKTEKKALRKLESTTVNPKSLTSFYSNFGDVPNVKWRSTVYFDEATFMREGKEMTAFFDFYGTLVGTTTVRTFADIPAKGQAEIKKMYSDYTIGPVIFYDDNEFNESDMMLYNLQFDDEDMYFVELTKGTNKIVVKVNMGGMVSFFKQL